MELGREVLRVPGVTSVWLKEDSDREAEVWITVTGLDELAFIDRQAVIRTVENFLTQHRSEIELSNFALAYFVVADDDDLGDTGIPEGARRIAT
jgi:hypothetical protein